MQWWSLALVLSACGGALGGTPDASTEAGDQAATCASTQLKCGETCIDPLSDSANCGGCGLSCPPGCTQGRCVQELAAIVGSPGAIATDGVDVYWSSHGPSNCTSSCATLNMVPTTSGPVVQLIDAGTEDIGDGPMLDDVDVYWLVSANTMMTGSISRMPRGGGVITTLATGFLSTFTVASGSLLYAVESPIAWSPQTIVAMSTSGGIASRLAATGWVTSIASDGVEAFWSSGGEADPVESLQAAPIKGQGARLLGYPNLAETILVDDAFVYYDDGAIERVPKVGGVPMQVAMPSPYGCSGVGVLSSMTIDGGYIYFTQLVDLSVDGQGTISKVPAAGGDVTTLVGQQSLTPTPQGRAITTDKTSVYWLAGSATETHVMKATPK